MGDNTTADAQPRRAVRWNARPRLIDLWRRLRFRSDILAQEAGVEEAVILRMFRFQEVSRETAEKVLAALSRLTGNECYLKGQEESLV